MAVQGIVGTKVLQKCVSCDDYTSHEVLSFDPEGFYASWCSFWASRISLYTDLVIIAVCLLAVYGFFANLLFTSLFTLYE